MGVKHSFKQILALMASKRAYCRVLSVVLMVVMTLQLAVVPASAALWFKQDQEVTGAEEGDDLSCLDALLVPQIDGEEVGLLQEKYPHLPIIPFVCRLDEGSGLYLEERIGRMRDERQQWPCARGL